ncbi:LRR receptor-like serine/threonine-protein kinase ERECTA [Hibiscus syriacus]|uniref:LRR receptor-like serine/threonine-protein kinase ERECTA n=1 Tax=Hibiscus syriacus TaxID=106335 RepID=A0A6A2YWJ1_HIBSY|nr:LRR receptor-like serine/threonine-protein kinase ERECTA [Hibiscus syriacus]
MTMAFRLVFVFLVSLFCLNLASRDSEDGTTLLDIKKSFRDVDNVLYDWTDATSSDYCVWRGVTCDNVTFNVVALNLSDLNLDGEISPAIGDLKDLITLGLQDGLNIACVIRDLSFNELYGDIPFSISKLKQLELLILKNNQLVGPIPSTLSQIPNLKVWFARKQSSWHAFSGHLPANWSMFDRSIPQNIGNCTAFQGLSYNQLTGEIPFNIGFLQIIARQSSFGEIPSVIGLMQALLYWISSNKLTGPIPSILGNLTYTEKLELNDNLLTEHIPSELGKLTELYDLNVANNKLEGPIPNLSSNNIKGSIPIELSRIGNLDTLDLSDNEISGSIPSSLGDLEHLLEFEQKSFDRSHSGRIANLRSVYGDVR